MQVNDTTNSLLRNNLLVASHPVPNKNQHKFTNTKQKGQNSSTIQESYSIEGFPAPLKFKEVITGHESKQFYLIIVVSTL